jgi:16S rRNA (guanine(527)-N(7))-methyltransferase RsmG
VRRLAERRLAERRLAERRLAERRVAETLAAQGIPVSESQLAQLQTHFDLLECWNARINLTSVRDPGEIERRHFAESAYLTKVLPLGPGKLIDVGSGAGFPGIPVKILSPETEVLLVESVQKKAAFLKEVAREIGLPGLEVFPGRLEDLPLGDAQWLTMRAVRLDRKLMRVIQRHVPRGTLAIFLGEQDTVGLGERVTVHPIPGSERRVIAIGECSTWNI